MMNHNTPELLSPAGSFASLKAAVTGGADAVYLGCTDFANARMNAENFTKETLVQGIDFCHSRGVKAYITVNTLLTDREMEGLYSYASFLYENGADALIVQDVGVMDFLHQNLPNLPLHASTQMGICNTAGIKAAKQLGCSRAVAARELSLQELTELCQESLEIEMFVHGALCVCYSGFCLMSSLIGRRSGNRGNCAQPCRLPYQMDGQKPALLLNLKDLMLLPYLQELKNIGVASLKIEGRMKGPDYVGLVTSVYRRGLDGEPISQQDYLSLQKAFDRGGTTDGYLTGKGAMFAYSKPATPYNNPPQPQEIRRPIPIFMDAILQKNQVFSLSVTDEQGNQAIAQGETPAFLANNRPLDEIAIKDRLQKLGDTPYQAKECNLTLDPGLMIPLGEIARVKREACERLTQMRIQSFKRPTLPSLPTPKRKVGVTFQTITMTATVNTIEQYRSIKDVPFAWIGIPQDVVWKHREELKGAQIALRLPSVIHEQKRSQMVEQLKTLRSMGFSMLLCGNVGDFYDFPDWDKKGDMTLWVYHTEAAVTLSKQHPSSLFLSPELNLAQIRTLKSAVPCETLVYGRIPLMTSKHCFVKSARGNCRGECALTDRKGTTFPTRCVNGEHLLYNSTPLYMGDQLQEFQNTCVAFGRISFTVETPEECKKIAREMNQPPEGGYTRGHYYRGV